MTITPRPIKSAHVALPNGVSVSARRFLWYYEAKWPDNTIAATLHLSEGIVLEGSRELWRVMNRDDIQTLIMPTASGSAPLASHFVGNTGLFSPVTRLTLGDDRSGGYILEGHGWRGSWLMPFDMAKRALLLTSEGDPPNVFHLTPSKEMPAEVPISIALLAAYILIEKEIKSGSWISRPKPASETKSGVLR